MKESKYQVLNWKRWKATAILLKETKKELENTPTLKNYSVTKFSVLPNLLFNFFFSIKILKT